MGAATVMVLQLYMYRSYSHICVLGMSSYSVVCQYIAQICCLSCKKKNQYLISIDSKVAISRGGFLLNFLHVLYFSTESFYFFFPALRSSFNSFANPSCAAINPSFDVAAAFSSLSAFSTTSCKWVIIAALGSKKYAFPIER